MALQIIVVGDATSHGGRVVTGSETHKVGDKGIARLFDVVDCPMTYPDGRPHGLNKIVEAHPTFTIDGRRVALHGHRSECGCTLMGSGTASIGD
ncbi:PAAR domain-containing protein [Burkholderia stabilis]|uniref:Uncharacterized conserved protein,PAAR motif n=1 Tax=Burkholderia stabilis TaxID=95485 RepID=A0AAJ5T6F0_9BURK|nr:PAAR domain-containing protein [Burkholderia stabilis]VBB14429.1 Uncharacterized conserved protein,PAAR motif [Burkholderia stabilis]